MRPVRVVRAWWGIVALAGGALGCETSRNPGGVQRDVIRPTIALSASADTQQIASGLQFTVTAGDNLGLKDIRLTYSGGYLAVTDTVFNTAVTTVTAAQNVQFPAGSGAGGFITIIGRATDGSGNFAEDTLVIFLDNVQALKVFLLAPTTGALASSGKGIPVTVQAQQLGGIQRIGFLVTLRSAVSDPTTPPTDSLVFTTRLPPDTSYSDTLTVLAASGTFDVTAFAVDAGGRRGVSNTVTVQVQSAANDVAPPTVSHTVPSRVEVSDTVTVHATDPSGIAWIGFRVDTVLNAAPPFTGITPPRFDSLNVGAGNLTDVTQGFSLNLAAVFPPGTQFPRSVVVRGYACDLAAARNCAYSQTSTVITGAAPRRAAAAGSGVDTVVVVAGVTRAFPLGGKIADAIFNPNLNELYLTNPSRHRVEIFQVANTTFVAQGITFGVGVPWGIALWPRNTLGQVGSNGDTIVVADAGGTQLAIVDVRTAVRQLQWRQDLPNFLIETYKILRVTGGTLEEITIHDVSDRPQYVATVCRTGGGTTCLSDSIYALYSTTPTTSSTSPFSGKATLRMEKLVSPSSGLTPFGHLFWEIGASFASTSTDTLRVEEIRGNARKVVLSACAGVTIKLDEFGLGDSTYARNSGNFTHGLFGEGGNITTSFARVMAYDARDSIQGVGSIDSSCVDPANTGRTFLAAGENHVDRGMSPGVHVSDFISNTGIKLSSIATNLNGLTNVVRADSIYYLDENLRLKGTSCTLAVSGSGCVIGASGMDMNYLHDFSPGGGCAPTCGGGTDKNNRFLFAARPDANIDVFDTFDGSQLLSGGAPVTIPLRDPIIGPLRVARDATGQLLFGITARGLVMVRLPVLTNPNPAPPRRR